MSEGLDESQFEKLSSYLNQFLIQLKNLYEGYIYYENVLQLINNQSSTYFQDDHNINSVKDAIKNTRVNIPNSNNSSNCGKQDQLLSKQLPPTQFNNMINFQQHNFDTPYSSGYMIPNNSLPFQAYSNENKNSFQFHNIQNIYT